jgi:hypothetical protein
VSRQRWTWLALLVGIPLLAGLAIRLLLASGALSNPVLKLTADRARWPSVAPARDPAGQPGSPVLLAGCAYHQSLIEVQSTASRPAALATPGSRAEEPADCHPGRVPT